jgi:hypothetical protein
MRDERLDDFDAKFWEGENDLCVRCMPEYMANELRYQERERQKLIAQGAVLGPVGCTGRTNCVKCGGPRPSRLE